MFDTQVFLQQTTFSSAMKKGMRKWKKGGSEELRKMFFRPISALCSKNFTSLD